ncbi:MAG: phosphoadenylyl-sulfate reductase [Gemmatimonadaceae bacterium]
MPNEPTLTATSHFSPLVLEQWQASDVLAWALATFRGRIALSASFGGGGIVLAHMLSQADRSVPILFLDTGFHFPETIDFSSRFAERYSLNVITLTPATAPQPLYSSDPDRCCTLHKVAPMHRALKALEVVAWVSALRRDQSVTRSEIRVLEQDDLDGRELIRIHPLAAWSSSDVREYIRRHELPYHPLLDHGYTSIGCQPCTRPTQLGEHERAGRWSGRAKTECGLHSFTHVA